eukprot:CAMPEP_0116966548 /NCGR_PEP_ID=MMETSP0467-20121206/49935_1 /TAXON_ID=283647 /ORGANISM="Mesodinium pulex, Strain SPMC105" /LENGTH=33 /DNA_ID= /DNA_START= /DNA_END= /DNA_ORIENTATION=
MKVMRHNRKERVTMKKSVMKKKRKKSTMRNKFI